MIGMIRVMYRLFKKLFNKEVNEEFGYYEAGGYMKAQSDIARRLISRGMSLTEIAGIVSIDEDELYEMKVNEGLQ